jgi:hypothetical protein
MVLSFEVSGDVACCVLGADPSAGRERCVSRTPEFGVLRPAD